MKGVALLLGVLLLAGGGAVGAVQFVPGLDLAFLESVGSAKEFLASKNALYAGAGAAGFGLVMLIVGLLPSGSKKRAPPPEIREATPPPSRARSETPRPAPRPVEAPKPVAQPAQPRPAPQAIQPKPVASAQPPASGRGAKATATAVDEGSAPTWSQDPRLTNRKRVSDLVSINDALKTYHAKHGKYPMAEKLGGYLDRGKNWIPGLSPEFMAELPRDPAMSNDKAGPQYLYASNGLDYKLVAQGVSLVGGTNVEVLGVKFDPSKNNTMEKAAFGFWTEKFAQI
jgi:hypothetical protein